MKLHGIIYQAPSRKKRFFYGLLRSFGAGLIAFAFVGIIFSFWPIVKEEVVYRFSPHTDVTSIIAKSDAQNLGLDPFFSIYVPKINAKAKVIANVDSGDPENYLYALSEGVAHARGTNFPGAGQTIFLFAHSTDSPLNFARYNAVFYLLGKLETGDRITVFFLSKKYQYVITDKTVASAADTSWLKDDGSGERLILQTCDPPGTTWRRLLIIARPLTAINN